MRACTGESQHHGRDRRCNHARRHLPPVSRADMYIRYSKILCRRTNN
jgi:hypothetical protein